MRDRTRIFGLLVCLLLLGVPAASRAADVNVSGEWQIEINTEQGKFTPVVKLKQDGEKLSGTYQGRFGESKLTGTLKGNAIKFQTTISAQGQAFDLSYSGTVESENEMKGKVEMGDFGSADWTGKRKEKDK